MAIEDFADLDFFGFLSIAVPAMFSIAILVFVVLGIILAYHWRKYALNLGASFLFQVFYWGAGGLLIVAMGAAVVAFRA